MEISLKQDFSSTSLDSIDNPMWDANLSKIIAEKRIGRRLVRPRTPLADMTKNRLQSPSQFTGDHMLLPSLTQQQVDLATKIDMRMLKGQQIMTRDQK